MLATGSLADLASPASYNGSQIRPNDLFQENRFRYTIYIHVDLPVTERALAWYAQPGV